MRIIDEFPRLARVVMSRCRSSVMDMLGYEMDLDFCLIVKHYSPTFDCLSNGENPIHL